MRKVGVIGSGACGNNVIKVVSMEETEFGLAAINSTEFDLEELKEYCDDIFLIGTEGCGKNRNSSKGLFKRAYTQVVNKLKEIFEGFDFVVAVSSLGGGTGSGLIAMLVDILRSQMPNTIFIVNGVLPSLSEDARSQSNALEALKEIMSLNVPYILVDNDRVNSLSLKEVYDKTNESILTDLKTIRGDYTKFSELGNMDDRDAKTLCRTPGLLSINKISGIKETDLDRASIDDFIIKSIRESYNVQIEKDKVIGKMGIILSVTQSMLDKIDKGFSKVKAEIGIPIDIFTHINVVDDKEQTSIITILAGLSAPESRIIEMTERVREASQSINRNVKTNLIEDSVLLDNVYEEENKATDSVDDILGKY